MRENGYFTYNLEDDMRAVQIEVFSLAGRLIEQLEGQTRAGYNQVLWTPAGGLGQWCVYLPNRGRTGKWCCGCAPRRLAGRQVSIVRGVLLQQ